MTAPFVVSTDSCPPPLPVATPAPDTVIAGGWFPDVDPAAIRRAHRIRDDVTAERLRAALIAAIITVGNDLEVWSALQPAASLAQVVDLDLRGNPRTIDGKPRLIILYLRAVALTAKAEIVERYRDIDGTNAGDRKVDAMEPSIGELRRDALHAIRDMLGRSRTTVELI
jgi:hypothetical protein